jgi:hypothetical protein
MRRTSAFGTTSLRAHQPTTGVVFVEHGFAARRVAAVMGWVQPVGGVRCGVVWGVV